MPGLILTADGPKLIEYNVRFGDPDWLPSLLRYRGDLTHCWRRRRAGELEVDEYEPVEEAVVTVVMASPAIPKASNRRRDRGRRRG